MAFLEINPDYRDRLRRLGLLRAEDFLALPAVIVSGHPDRNVAQVALGGVAAFLKREHRVPWKERLANAWSGFGWVSKSRREATTLRALRQAGVACPDWIAAGEDDRGRAFLLLREASGTVDLRRFLQRLAPARDRHRLARRLGRELARLHGAGFDHPDLYAKHVLVNPDDGTLHFLDWQRSRRGRPSWRQRCRDLAALHATLADDLASPRERLACLRAYLGGERRGSSPPSGPPGQARRLASCIERLARRLLRKRRIREMRQPPLAIGAQNLIWLDGEALCVTREFWAELGGHLPAWLAQPYPVWRGYGAWRTRVALAGGGLLVRRREWRPLARLAAWLRGRVPTSPELRQAGHLFRLQRQGVATPRLLAVGQRPVGWGSVESFLLVETAAGARRGREAASGARREPIHSLGGGEP